MVYFTCNHCGDSLKKNGVDKHYYGKCRNSKFLTCVDCMKDFRGEEYAAHTKCITEDEKYAAKGFKSSEPSMKGEEKQQSWLELMTSVYENKSDLRSDQRALLNQLLRHSNVPQKAAKFMNFIRNISPRTSKMTINMLWTTLQTEKNARKEKEAKPEAKKSEENGKEISGKNESENNTVPQQTKKVKKNKKARQKKTSSQEDVTSGNSENGTDDITGEVPDGSKNKKKKKVKGIKGGDLAEEMETVGLNEKHSKSKKKRKHEEEQVSCGDVSAMKKNKFNGRINEPMSEGEEEKKSTEKFNWCNVIVKVLESSDNQELSVKKLRKKVLAEFSSTGKAVDESVSAKFTKKLSKIPVVLLLKDKAKLKK